MKKIIIFRGAPGSGKSHTIREAGLGDRYLSMDAIRRIVGGVDMLPDGSWAITQEQNRRVYEMFRQITAERMARGETLALEAVFADIKGLREMVKLAREHRYRVAVVDFHGVPEEQVRAQNANREPLLSLSEQAMDRWLRELGNQGPVPQGLADVVIPWKADGSHVKAVRDFIDVPVLDVSSYEKIVFIGDLQGCATPLLDKGGLLENGFEDNALYVFMGDLLDRGPENGRLMRWFMDNAVPRHGQVRWLHGNHEDHLHRFSRGWPSVSAEFRERTLPQLHAAGITPEDADKVCELADEALLLQWRDKKIMAVHAGLPTVPRQIGVVSTYQLSHGTGSWNDPVDHQFSRLAPDGWTQVHGHRNHGDQPIIATPQSINLEGKVDKGGELRAAILDDNGWTPISIQNENFVPVRDRLPRRQPEWAPAWISRPKDTVFPADVLATMREHPEVRESVSSSMPHIASLNFSKRVFFNKSWDEVSVKARGLFFDRESGEIVCRGYDKFFNIGERPETSMEALEQTMKAPVACYLKENGYLGNLGYDTRNHALVFASKSTPDSDFAAWFKEIFEQNTTAAQRENVRRFLRDFECSMVFEVIDPVRDPHMVDYDHSRVVLLDVFHRSISGEKLPYNDLKRVGKALGLEVKQRAMMFHSFEQMKGFLASKEGKIDWKYEGKLVEGFVMEDAAGFMTKDKTAGYSFWKSMRGAKDRLAKAMLAKQEVESGEAGGRKEVALREAQKKVDEIFDRAKHPLARDFIDWAATQDPIYLAKTDILSLRKAYEVARSPDPSMVSEPWDPYAKTKPASRSPRP